MAGLAPLPEAWGDGGKTLVRILDEQGYDDFGFAGSAGEVLFVDLQASVYQTQGRMGGGHEATEAAAGTLLIPSAEGSSGGCSGEEEGPGGFCLQVLDAEGTAVCWADRPVQPGWQRDPRLACPLPADGSYTLRVFLRGEVENACARTSGYSSAAGLEEARRLYSLEVARRDCAAAGSLELGGGKR